MYRYELIAAKKCRCSYFCYLALYRNIDTLTISKSEFSYGRHRFGNGYIKHFFGIQTFKSVISYGYYLFSFNGIGYSHSSNFLFYSRNRHASVVVNKIRICILSVYPFCLKCHVFYNCIFAKLPFYAASLFVPTDKEISCFFGIFGTGYKGICLDLHIGDPCSSACIKFHCEIFCLTASAVFFLITTHKR